MNKKILLMTFFGLFVIPFIFFGKIIIFEFRLLQSGYKLKTYEGLEPWPVLSVISRNPNRCQNKECASNIFDVVHNNRIMIFAYQDSSLPVVEESSKISNYVDCIYQVRYGYISFPQGVLVQNLTRQELKYALSQYFSNVVLVDKIQSEPVLCRTS